MNVGFSIPSRADTEPLERTFDLRQYLNFIWRNWMFIASVTALVFLIGVIYLVHATPSTPRQPKSCSNSTRRLQGWMPRNDRLMNNFGYVENQLAILQSDSLLRRVVIKERLAASSPSANESQGTERKQGAISVGGTNNQSRML